MKPIEIALSLLSRKSFHSLELAKKLRDKGVEEGEVAPLIQRLKAEGYLDDEGWEERFIEAYIRKGKGVHLLAPTLHQKGLIALLPRLKRRVVAAEEGAISALVNKYQGVEKRATFIISSQDSGERGKSGSKRSDLHEEGMAEAMPDEEDQAGEAAAGRIPNEMMKVAQKRLLIQRLQRRGFNLESILQIVKQSDDVL